MQKIKWKHPDIGKPLTRQKTGQGPPEKRGLIRCIPKPALDDRNVLLHEDLGIHHVRLAEHDAPPRVQDPFNFAARSMEVEVMEHRDPHDDIERLVWERQVLGIADKHVQVG